MVIALQLTEEEEMVKGVNIIANYISVLDKRSWFLEYEMPFLETGDLISKAHPSCVVMLQRSKIVFTEAVN